MSQNIGKPPEEDDEALSLSQLQPHEEMCFSAPAPQIEGYRIIEKLGEAGQGQVWRAAQLSTGRQVALKVPRIGLLSSKSTLARFEREVEIAAALRHPHIARILDSGVHRGLYYYAMDLVDGRHLDRYVSDNALSPRQILELMRVVCDAVQHAHQNGVIHRDLKPSNIIVTQDGHPYIVDFGLAKNIKASETATAVSVDGEAAGTPAYMSPEQATGHADQVDTRTDVYSLGAILFTLLTGQYPHDLSGSHLDVLRRIMDGEITPPRKLCPKMDRDLEALLLKALEHAPNRRYSSAAGLAEDIGNYLHGLPLSATPPLRIRRVGSFVRRHRVGVTLGVSLSLMGVIAVAALATSAIIADQERRQTREALEREQDALCLEIQARTEAQRQTRIAQAIADFLNRDLLTAVDPALARGRQLTVREVLDAASERIEGRFTEEPLVEASIRCTLGNTYTALGRFTEAARHLECAHRLYQEHLGKENPASLHCMASLGWVYRAQGRYTEAEPLCRDTLQIAGEVFGDDDPHTLAAMGNLAFLYYRQDRFDEARVLYEKELAIERRVLGDDHLGALNTMLSLALLYSDQGRYQEADRLYTTAIGEKERQLGKEHPDTLRSKNNLATMYMNVGRYTEALTHCEQVADAMKRTLGEEHPDTLRALGNLASLYDTLGQYDRAESLSKEILEVGIRTLGENHPDALSSLINLASLYCNHGRYQDAEPLFLKAVDATRRILGGEHRLALLSANNLAILYRQQGRYQEAEGVFLDVVQGMRRTLGEEHPQTLASMNQLAILYSKTAQYQKAETLYVGALTTQERVLGKEHLNTLDSLHNLATLYRDQERYEEAEPLYRREVEARERVLGKDHPYTIRSTDILVRFYEAWGKPTEAMTWRTGQSRQTHPLSSSGLAPPETARPPD